MKNDQQLRRDLGLFGAITTGLGSILGTGVFVSIGIAAGVAGPNVLIAIFLAAIVASLNGLSSAQLAANHPVSGGTYEYGHRWLGPSLGFIAGWLFLCAKSASAATAALGLAGYISTNAELSGYGATVGTALAILAVLTALTFIGIRRTSIANMLIVGTTLAALLIFSLIGLGGAIEKREANLASLGFGNSEGFDLQTLFQATALMFVAYTGYGRIATMGEEVAEPRKTIPKAIVTTLWISMLLYLLVAFVAVGNVGAEELGNQNSRSAPLMYVATQLNSQPAMLVISIGAITAMLGVLLNLLLGLSRVALAMSRRSDLPIQFSAINSKGVPTGSTLFIAFVIGAIVLSGDVKLAWSFSAFCVLVYYGLTNLCAIRIAKSERLYPAWLAWAGLISCAGLLFFLRWEMALIAGGIVAVGFLLRYYFQKQSNTPA